MHVRHCPHCDWKSEENKYFGSSNQEFYSHLKDSPTCREKFNENDKPIITRAGEDLMMRKYAALWNQSTLQAYVIFNDHMEKEWYVYTTVDDFDRAKEIAEQMNR